MTLIRSAIVRITTLVIYIVAAYAAIQCTQPSDMQVAQFNVTLSHNRTVCHEVCHDQPDVQIDKGFRDCVYKCIE